MDESRDALGSLQLQQVAGWESPAASMPFDVSRLVYEPPSLVIEVAHAEYEASGLYKPLVANADTVPWPIVRFEVVRGFRVLDETDLLEFWQAGYPISESLVWQVEQGGWFDELAGQDRVVGWSGDIVEYLVATGDDCVTVLSANPPSSDSDTPH